MKPRYLILTTLVAGLSLAATAVAAGSDSRVPITERLTGYQTSIELATPFPAATTFDGRCSEPSNYIITFAGTGKVSHLGTVTWSSVHCTQFFSRTATDGVLTIAAANGDTLVEHYTANILDETTASKEVTFASGTGRFAHANGHLDGISTWYPDTLRFDWVGSGWITYDASDRTK